MDTGKTLMRQLGYCLRGAETREQREQIEWWIARVDAWAKEQPSAEPVQLEFSTRTVHAATGTEGAP